MSSVNSIGSNYYMEQRVGGTQNRPDPKKMAENLFSVLDSSGQGYFQKSDLQNALNNISSSNSNSSSTSSDTTSNVDSVFSALDSNGDGKVTKQEFTDSLDKLHKQFEDHYQNGRMQAAMQAGGMSGMNGMPPPPPPPSMDGGSDQGFTKDQLTSQLNEITSTDSKQSSLISNLIQNFDKVDTNGDGKISFQEVKAFDSTNNSNAVNGTNATQSSASNASTTTSTTEEQIMMQIMKLMQAYMTNNNSSSASTLASTLATIA